MLGIVLMMPLVSLASDKDPAQEIRVGALREANGDTNQAFIILSLRTASVLDRTFVLESDIELRDRAIDRYKEYYGYNDKSWLEKTWDSDAVKVGLFIGGIWLGTTIVKNVN